MTSSGLMTGSGLKTGRGIDGVGQVVMSGAMLAVIALAGVAIIALMVFAVIALNRGNRAVGSRWARGEDQSDPLRFLDEQFASGEIDLEAYQAQRELQRKADRTR